MIENREHQSILDTIEKFLPYQIDFTANFNKSFRREFQAKFVDTKISPDEFMIMHLLYDDEKVSQTELAKLLFKGKAHVGKILNEMEEKGLIKRTVDVRNNIMVKKNVLTESGVKLVKLGLEKAKIIADRMQKEFSQEEEQKFIQYLVRYRNTLESIVDVKLK